MILFREDIERILSLGYDRNYFVEYRDGFYRLKNPRGRCIFLNDEGRCTIYQHRPLGCRLYPLVFSNNEEPLLDPECPLTKTSMIKCTDIVEGLKLLRKVLKYMENEYKVKINWGNLDRGSKKLVNIYCEKTMETK
jgi:Fe-S-cluster containining protein